MNQAKRLQILDIFRQVNPNPRTELTFNSNFELLIAVMLSAQATDVSVNKATQKLYAVAKTPQQIYALGVEGLIPYIKTIGLFNAKAKNIIATCKILIDQYNSEVPADRDALTSLPGVGRKTANVVLSQAFGIPAMAVDTHVFRVSNRMNFARGKNVDQVEAKLMKVIPREDVNYAHHWLILHGRYVCQARKPKCYECPVAHLCEFKDKTVAP